MEVKSQFDKSQLSFNSTDSFSHKSIKLGNHKRRPLKSLTNSYEKSIPRIDSDLLSSISRKLQVNNIEVYSKKDGLRMSDPYHDKSQTAISCFPQMLSMKFGGGLYEIKKMQYSSLRQNRSKVGTIIIENVHGKGERKGCLQQHCPVQRKWLRNIIFYQKQLKNLLLLKERMNQCPVQVRQQIDKDVHRTFAGNLLVKTRIAVSQSTTEKYNLIENLRTVLRLYAIYDPVIGYVQGMNLMASSILLHMKDVNSSFIYLKEVMNYGKLREFYLQNFDFLKRQLKDLFQKQLKFINTELYNFLMNNGIDHIIFVPYYLTLFASFVDIHYMHIVIDQFMKQGIKFLHKFMLVLLLFLKPTLMRDDEEDSPITKLGNNFIKNASIDWEQILMSTQKIDLI